MTRFTDSPFERMMMQKPCGGMTSHHKPALPKNHPCYGCPYVEQGCMGVCYRDLMAQINGRRKEP
ncbi:MAG: hypothetical protein U0K87_12145 [Ruminococcus sp.]|nr:hypothetical protein [Ruminococcus sp.]